MTLTVDEIVRALNRVYNPPIRGRFSKKRRIRKKAEKKFSRTAAGIAMRSINKTFLAKLQPQDPGCFVYYGVIPK